MVIPPPNVTGALHLGHAINGTIQDVLARYHRMRATTPCGCPGSTMRASPRRPSSKKRSSKGEQKPARPGPRGTRQTHLGLEGTVWDPDLQPVPVDWDRCDWDRTRFTLDDVCRKAVREAFFKMFKDGLIFRGKRLVNWDTHLQTAVADDEIYHETVKGQMTLIKYPVASEADKGDKERGTPDWRNGISHRRDDAAGDDAGRHRGRGASR